MKSLKEKAYKNLKEMIISGKLKSNERIDEDLLSKSLDVSRTPIREAINKLEQEGWINIIPRKGMFVNNVSIKEINDVFQVRNNFEPIILEMAFERIEKKSLEELRSEFLFFLNKKELSSEDNIKLDFLDNQLHLLILKHCNNNFIIKMMENVYEHNMRIRNLSVQPKKRRITATNEHIKIIDAILAENFPKALKELKLHNLKAKEGFFNSFN
jgi:DNA-binding GntR family transcriptional regulator